MKKEQTVAGCALQTLKAQKHHTGENSQSGWTRHSTELNKGASFERANFVE